jgi:hypothetical protein
LAGHCQAALHGTRSATTEQVSAEVDTTRVIRGVKPRASAAARLAPVVIPGCTRITAPPPLLKLTLVKGDVLEAPVEFS